VRLTAAWRSLKTAHVSRTGQHALAAVGLFSLAIVLRRLFFCGFVLGDDVEDFAMLRDLLSGAPDWREQLHLRFGVWLFIFCTTKILGVSETTFFLPTWVVSSSLPVIAYCLFVVRGQSIRRAFFQSLLLAVAPFEVVIGTVHTNDLFLSWCVALGLLATFGLRNRPVTQGLALAVLAWFGFYVKLWVVYFLPALALLFIVEFRRGRRWAAAASFTAASTALHGSTFLTWKLAVGDFMPFLHTHAATYPVATADLLHTFGQYPGQIFIGSSFGTTLFGLVPHAFLLLLGLKLSMRWWGNRESKFQVAFGRWDDLDLALAALSGCFFLLLNFFPNTFKFDGYYSAPRIFRYLAPLSLLVTIHVAKLLGDLLEAIDQHRGSREGRHWRFALLAAGLALNIAQAHSALSPALTYRRAFLAVVADIRALNPPLVIAHEYLRFWLDRVYLSPQLRQRTTVISAEAIHRAVDHERWLHERDPEFPPGTYLVSGLSSYVFFGAHADGFRLARFKTGLDSRWALVKDYGRLDYLPLPENVRLWRRTDVAPTPGIDVAQPTEGTPDELLAEGMKYFDQRDYFQARRFLRQAIELSPNDSEDAQYFFAVTYYREHRWREALAAFEKLSRTGRRWVAGAYWHIGMCHSQMGDDDQARRAFVHVIDRYPTDAHLVQLSRTSMRGLDMERGWLRATLARVKARFAH
jgi:tetratricopeptide (TPR) repeat protein